MTVDFLRTINRPLLTLAQVSAVIGIDPNTLRWQARDNPEALGFPVIVAKSRVYVPRLPFIEFMTMMPGERRDTELNR